MSTITLTRNPEGKLEGLGEKARRAWTRLKGLFNKMQPGEIVVVEFSFPRNPKFHKLHFALLNAMFDAQEQFEDFDRMRMYLTVGAGHCDFIPGPTGRMVAVPKSIAYNALDDQEFSEHHEAVKRFIRSDVCMRFFWPHLSPEQAAEMVEGIVRQFEGAP